MQCDVTRGLCNDTGMRYSGERHLDSYVYILCTARGGGIGVTVNSLLLY